ncbi:MAG: hypothetical protein ACYCO5_14745, partial [Acidobacteriaceae bacterium]
PPSNPPASDNLPTAGRSTPCPSPYDLLSFIRKDRLHKMIYTLGDRDAGGPHDFLVAPAGGVFPVLRVPLGHRSREESSLRLV